MPMLGQKMPALLLSTVQPVAAPAWNIFGPESAGVSKLGFVTQLDAHDSAEPPATRPVARIKQRRTCMVIVFDSI
jgi:hypothetical protein